MSASKNIAELGRLVAVHHGWAAAKAFKAYEMDDGDRAKISHAALEILKLFPPVADAGPLLTAALAVRLEQRLDAPVYMVAGRLLLDRVAVLSEARAVPMKAFPTENSGDYAGHCWLMVGAHVVDVNIFRLAYSAQGPAALSRHVDLVFGPNKGLYVDGWSRTRRMGLKYEPEYVLSEAEVTQLMGQAFSLIKAHQETI